MGANTKLLRNRIKSVNSTLHLTKAMGLVASSKIRRSSEYMAKSKQYLEAVDNIINALSSSPECKHSVYMEQRDGEKTKLIVIAGDRGLAGGYNNNIFKLCAEYKGAEIIPIGKKVFEKYGGGYDSSERFSYSDAIEVSNALCEEFKNGDFDRIGIIYTKYESMMTQTASVYWLLPLTETENSETYSMVFEPNEETVFQKAVPEYVAGVIWACVCESFASEVAARRMAMDAASKNAGQMIDDLQLEYNRARQSAITQEITEIIAGSNAT